MRYFVKLGCEHGMGDTLCLLSSCIEFINRTGNTVCLSESPEMIAAYNVSSLQYGSDGADWNLVLPYNNVWIKEHGCNVPEHVQTGIYLNYLGYYHVAMGLHRGDCPRLNMPVLERCDGRILIQPYSRYAQNPPDEFIQVVVDIVADLTGEEIFVIGREDTPRRLKGVKYDLLKNDVRFLMQNVQSARLVLTPRSFTAHVAAGYNTPTFVWCPPDNLSWHLDYQGWCHVRTYWKGGIHQLKVKIAELLERKCQ